jgi:hypothetical protein
MVLIAILFCVVKSEDIWHNPPEENPCGIFKFGWKISREETTKKIKH